MDPILKAKIQAINKYKKHQFLHSLILYSFTALTCSLLISGPFWFPHLISSMKVFLFVSLPNIASFFFNPKFLFIVGNAIIVFLVGESKFVSSYSSLACDIYDECLKKSQSLPSLSTVEEKKEEGELEVSLIEEGVKKVEEDEVKEEKGEEKLEGESEKKGSEDSLDGDDEPGLPAEELNKKVEDFIAKVNKQRRLEAKLHICSTLY